jgi:hypothetical protein
MNPQIAGCSLKVRGLQYRAQDIGQKNNPIIIVVVTISMNVMSQ